MSTATPQIAQVAPLHKPASARTAASRVSPELADLARLSVKDVAALIGRGEQSIRDMVKAGKFPPADHRDGPRCVRWSAGLVRQWLESTRTTSKH